MKEKILVKFGQKVKELRLKQNISQEKLAEKANVHRTYIGMIERAEKNITLINIEKIAKAIVLRKNIQDTQLQNKTKQNKL
ncbi:helix-turn-helix transcriptional regulator [Geminocystis sp. GBBB08]|uniref:helix-turn-helix domain-containing protein n=1 Tax=Geminocystis sp. GBBB08 TaxID=2604140 RepID=UPI0027E2871F|nr:helix-turn-helix transcriptional regulator [Geminocystis sp. GBBB08]